MAASDDDCRLCGAILSKKQRRTIFGDTFGVFNQLSQVIAYVANPNDGLSRFVCAFCFNKLNKLAKIDYDLIHKVELLQVEKTTIVTFLKEKHSNVKRQPCTPKSDKKRGMFHSPTPRKTKKAFVGHTPTSVSSRRRLLGTTPPKQIVHMPSGNLPSSVGVSHPASSANTVTPVVPKKASVKLFSPSKVKVMYRTKSQHKIRSKLIQDGQYSRIVKNIALHNSHKRTAKIIWSSPLNTQIRKCALDEMKKEMRRLTSSINFSQLRKIDSKSLSMFKFANLNTEIKTWAPFFHECISMMVKDSGVGTAVVSSMALKFHNTHMSALQHIIGQILDHGGATDEFIYQKFYNKSSAADQGTLSNLRNIIGRVEVVGPEQVVEKYRAHCSFLDDTLDAFIVAACMDLLGLSEITSDANRKQPLFAVLGKADKLQFLHTIAKEVLDKYVKVADGLENIQKRSMELDQQMAAIRDMFNPQEQKYMCCNHKYKTVGHLKRHLRSHHDWFDQADESTSSKPDHIALYRASFLKCALLFRDICDAYKMADGDRIAETAKFQLLLSHIGNHTKYQLWMFRFLANIVALLSPKMSYEYKWNCTSNLHGGIGHNIPNDNLVEIQVQNVKKKIHDQGSNATFSSAHRAAVTTQVQQEIKENMRSECEVKPKGTKRPSVSKKNDIIAMAEALISAEIMHYIPGREYTAFPNFTEMYSRVKIGELHKWISKGKERLSYEMV